MTENLKIAMKGKVTLHHLSQKGQDLYRMTIRSVSSTAEGGRSYLDSGRVITLGVTEEQYKNLKAQEETGKPLVMEGELVVKLGE